MGTTSTVTVTLTGDEKRLLDSLDKVIAKERELGRAGQEAARQHVDAAKKVQDEYGKLGGEIEKAADKLGKFGGAAVAVGLLAKVAAEAKKEINGIGDAIKRVTEAASGQARSEAASFSRLAQIAPGDPAKFSKAVALAKSVKDQSGLSEQEATQAVLGLDRAGILTTSGAELAIRAGRVGLGGDAIGQAAAVQRGLGKKITTEGIEQLLGRAQAAAPGEVPQFLDSLARSAPIAAGLGIGENEFVGAEGQLSRVLGPERASRAMHQFLENLAKHHVKGDSLAGIVRQEKGRHISARRAIERYGAEGADALNLLDPAALAADGAGGLQGADDMLRAEPGIATVLDDRDARADEDRQLQGRGLWLLGRETRRAQHRIGLRRRGNSEGAIKAKEDELDSSSLFGAGDYFSRPGDYGDYTKREAAGGFIETNYFKSGGGVNRDSREVLQEIAEATKAAAENTRLKSHLVRPEGHPGKDDK